MQVRGAVVALGASAGGLAAFERFFRAVEPGSGLAFVVVQHLSPEHESILPQLLSAFTKMPVESVVDGTVPAPDRVYVIPPGATLVFREGRLRLDTLEPRASRQPISAFFSSLAAELGPDAVAVVLSGTGSDGAAGLHAVRARRCLTVVQSPSEAQYDSMPRSALATGDADMVVSAADMPALIVRELSRRAAEPREPRVAAPAEPLAAITDSLRRHTGKEFGGFKRTTLLRRVQRRLAALGISGLSEYVARLEGRRG
jgi:two-component system CheB/CheR fusion protein